MAKAITTYNLDTDNVSWVKEQAEKDRRPASVWLDMEISRMRMASKVYKSAKHRAK